MSAVNSTPYRIALVGAPNTGKTAIFNAITGSRRKIANYSGVTVDRAVANLAGFSDALIVDLPGAYSLCTTSGDEQVTRDVLLGESAYEPRPDAILAVADATNLRMSLRMILELKLLGLPMIVALNLSDVAAARGLKIDENKLSEQLGVPVVSTVAIRKNGTDNLYSALQELLAARHVKASTTTSDPQASEASSAVKSLTFSGDTLGKQIDALDSSKLYAEVDGILAQALEQRYELPAWHRAIDSAVLHPVLGIVILLGILFLMFQSVYAWAAPFMDGLEGMVGWFGGVVEASLPEGLLRSLLVDGIIAGVGSVVVFVPQIAILFLFILVLEDSGYLPRAAFLLDNTLKFTGLSGRSFIPLLSGFACAVPAVMSTRTIMNPFERLLAISVIPILTCSARLPVYALIIAAVVPAQKVGWFNLQGLTLFGLYVTAIVSAGFIAWLSKVFIQRKEAVQTFPLLMELPTYRTPNVRHVLTSLWEKVSAFLKRAGTIIFALSVILWVLVTFPAAPVGASRPAIDYSFAGLLGRVIEPVFAPIGFTWEMCIAMIPGLAAREVVVAALGTVYAVAGETEEAVGEGLMPIIQSSWGLPTAFAFLAWYIYAPMCLATLAVIRRETGSRKQTLIITAYLTALAYFFAFVVYRVSLAVLG